MPSPSALEAARSVAAAACSHRRSKTDSLMLMPAMHLEPPHGIFDLLHQRKAIRDEIQSLPAHLGWPRLEPATSVAPATFSPPAAPAVESTRALFDKQPGLKAVEALRPRDGGDSDGPLRIGSKRRSVAADGAKARWL